MDRNKQAKEIIEKSRLNEDEKNILLSIVLENKKAEELYSRISKNQNETMQRSVREGDMAEIAARCAELELFYDTTKEILGEKVFNLILDFMKE